MLRTLKLELIFACTALLAVFSALPAHATTVVEVVQSVPIETSLAVPAIRQTQAVWLEMIYAARSTIDLEEFYVSSKPGEPLSPVLAAIRDAAARGVHVRLLVDSKFYKTYPHDPNALSLIPNIQVKTIDFSAGVQHSKYFIVDRAEAYLGSANFDWLALSHIHEVGLRIKDPGVSQMLGAVFEKDWAEATQVRKPGFLDTMVESDLVDFSASDSGLHVIASPPLKNPDGLPDSLTAITRLLDSAQTSLRIQLYQYSIKPIRGPKKWLTLDSAIRRAAKRGVHVQLLTDAVALKSSSAALKALAALANIEVRTVTLPEWSGGHLDYARLIHSKYCTTDGSVSWVGTENWSENYFTASRNVGLILQSAETASSLGQIFNRVWGSAYATAL